MNISRGLEDSSKMFPSSAHQCHFFSSSTLGGATFISERVTLTLSARRQSVRFHAVLLDQDALERGELLQFSEAVAYFDVINEDTLLRF